MAKYPKGRYENTFAVDKLTGSIEGQIIPLRKSNLQKETNFFMGDKSLAGVLSRDKELTGQPLKVLLFIISELENGNTFRISQKKVAKELGIDPVRVSAAMRVLILKKIIKRDEVGGVRGCYLLNPEYFWEGERNKCRSNYNKA